MKFPALRLLFFLGVSLTGCSYQYVAQSVDSTARAAELKAHYQVERTRNIAVRPANSVCLAPVMLADVEFQQQLQDSLLSALQARFVNVSVLAAVESANGALREAWGQRCDLLFYPILLRREDNAWSLADWGDSRSEEAGVGMDKLQLGISLWDVNGAQVLDQAVIGGRSAWLDLYSSNSADLIAAAIDRYLQQLVTLR